MTRAPAVDRLRVLLAVLYESARIQAVITRSSPAVVVLAGVQPTALLILAMPHGGGQRDVATRVLISVLVTCLWGGLVWMAGGIIRRDIVQGTLSRSVVGVWDARLVLIGKCGGAVVFTCAVLTAVGGAVTLVLGVRPRVGAPGPLLLGLLVVVFSAVAMGTLLSSVFVLTRHGLHVGNALLYPVYILGGTLLPAELIPVGLRWIAWLVPLHWAKEFMVEAALGKPPMAALGATVALAVCYLLAGLALLRKVVDRARERGTLEFT